jgi:hypothetical protein
VFVVVFFVVVEKERGRALATAMGVIGGEGFNG